MRVVIEAQPMLRQRTGVGQYTYHLIEHLVPLLERKGIDLTLFYFNFLKRNRELPQWAGAVSVREQRLFPGRCFYFLWKKRNFPPLNWLAGSADLYHFPNFIVRPLSSGKPVITIHDLSFVRYPQYVEKKNLSFLNHGIPISIEKARKICVVSEFTKRELMEIYGTPEEKIVVTPNGVTSEFVPVKDAAQLQTVRQKYRLPEQFLLSVGTLEPRKNLVVLLEALSLLKKEKKEVPPLVLVGPPGWNNEYERLKRWVEGQDLQRHVTFLFYVDRGDMPAVYNAARILVFPSLYEGFGLPVLEAMACGTPVLASDAASIPEVGGRAPLYILPTEPEAWAEAIAGLWGAEHLLQEMSQRGMERARQFSWQRTAEKTLEAYEQADRD